MTLKKNCWPELGKEKNSLEKRILIENEIRLLFKKTEIPRAKIVLSAGVSKSTWHEWQPRKGIETRHNQDTPRLNWYMPSVFFTMLSA